jgi:hypothetical protein
MVVGRATYKVGSGKTSRVVIKLSSRARTALRKSRKPMRAALTMTASRGRAESPTATLRLKPASRQARQPA